VFKLAECPLCAARMTGVGRFLSSDVHRTKRLLCIREQPFVFLIDRCQVYCRR
jgi:hypothetical protein